MKRLKNSRCEFLSKTVMASSAGLAGAKFGMLANAVIGNEAGTPALVQERAADYTLRIGAAAIDIGKNRIVSAVTYNGQFPGPLLRFKEGQAAVVEVHNDTDTPEQLHWHGQFVSTDVEGAAEEGTPYIPAHGMRRIELHAAAGGAAFLSHA
jgi:FtsP/CotA-like multicopper oxidase with cupredoxin domain